MFRLTTRRGYGFIGRLKWVIGCSGVTLPPHLVPTQP